ncbi:MAG: TonB-dependent receptor, partial [Pyrinomonadaceae bacterium]
TFSLTTSYGNQRTGDATLFAAGERGAWAASLGAEASRTAGYVLVNEESRGRVDTPAGSRHAAADVTLGRRAGAGGRVFARFSYFGERRANGTPLQTNRTHVRQLTFGGDAENAWLGSVSVRAYGGTQVYDQIFTAVSANRERETLTRVQRVPSQFAGLSVQWSRAAGARHTLVAGLDAREVRGASDEIIFAGGRATSLVGAGGRERTVGLFVEDILNVTPRLQLTAGARLDRWREFKAHSTTAPIGRPEARAVRRFDDRDETAFSPQLSALYRVNDSVSLAASFSRAFRQPTLNELYRSFRVGDVLTLANEELRAERLTGGEGGAIFRLFGGRVFARGTFFRMDVTRPVANVTQSVTPALITRQRQNLGRMRSRGVEVEAEARLGGRLSVAGGYLLAGATVIEFPADAALEGLRVPQVARHQFTFRAQYAAPARFNFGLQGRGSGDQFDDDRNLLPLGRYFTLDALVSRRLRRDLDVFAAAENLTGRRYTVGRTPVETLGPPLLVRAGVMLRLGGR